MKQVRDPEAFRDALAERGMSQRQAARLVGCSHSVPTKILRGDRISVALATQFARALRRPLGELFRDALSTSEPVNVNDEASA